MDRTLGWLAITGPILAALATALISGEWFLLLLVAFVIAVGVLLLLRAQGTRRLVVAIALFAAAGLGVLGVTPINGENFDLTPFYENLGPPYIAGLGLLAAAAVLAVAWERVQRSWLRYAALASLLLPWAVLFTVDRELFGTASDPGATLPAGLFCLIGLVAGVLLSRSSQESQASRPADQDPARPAVTARNKGR